VEISFGGILNPRSFQPSDIFLANTYDSTGNDVGGGKIDNIRMNTPAKYDGFTIEPKNTTNGVIADYIVTYTAKIPLDHGDMFYITFPKTIRTPKEP
jgi:hypothetical protein